MFEQGIVSRCCVVLSEIIKKKVPRMDLKGTDIKMHDTIYFALNLLV